MLVIETTRGLLWLLKRLEFATINKLEYGEDWLVLWLSLVGYIFTCDKVDEERVKLSP